MATNVKVPALIFACLGFLASNGQFTDPLSSDRSAITSESTSKLLDFSGQKGSEEQSAEDNLCQWVYVGTQGITGSNNDFESIDFQPLTGEPYIVYSNNGKGDHTEVQRYDNELGWILVGENITKAAAHFQDLAFHPSTLQPHIIYSDASLGLKATVKYYNGDFWQRLGNEGFSDGVTLYNSIAFQPGTHRLFVAFSDGQNHMAITVMYFENDAWHTLGDTGFSEGAAQYVDLAFHPETQQPYVVYQDIANQGKTTVQRHNGVEWVTVGNAGFSEGNSSFQKIQFNQSDNEPYVVYSDNKYQGATIVQHFNGDEWLPLGKALSEKSSAFQSIAFQPSTGTPYVAFRDNAMQGKANVKYYDGDEWLSLQSNGVSEGNAHDLAIAFHPNTEELYIIYKDMKAAGSCSVKRMHCKIPGCMDDTACNYDDKAEVEDDSCFYEPCYDERSHAKLLIVSPVGNCHATQDDINQAKTPSPEGCSTGVDFWYKFEALTGGITITLDHLDWDASVELQDETGNRIDCENLSFSGTKEILNVGNLKAGALYYVAVANEAPAENGLFDICVESHKTTTCSSGPGPYSLCNTFKAKWVGGSDYIFHFKPIDSDEVFTETGYYYNSVQLYKSEGMSYNHTYEVSIDVVHPYPNGIGEMEPIQTPGIVTCFIEIGTPPTTHVDSKYDCVNRENWLNDYIWANQWTCGATDWEWEFTSISNGTTLFAYSNSPIDKLRLASVPGIVPGESYHVRVRAHFADDGSAEWGEETCIKIHSAGFDPLWAAENLDNYKTTEQVDQNPFIIYPSPSDGNSIGLIINGVPALSATLEVIDVQGKLVHRELIQLSEGSIRTTVQFHERLTSGLYWVRILEEDHAHSEQMVVYQ